jgi:predicted GNAT family N-acyltransferase
MAADREHRGRGHGAAVLAELHRQALRMGLTATELHAQVGARGFYERAGYTAVGGEYLEAGIRHVTDAPHRGRRPPGTGVREGSARGETRSVRPSA